jgi:hypothetical protein
MPGLDPGMHDELQHEKTYNGCLLGEPSWIAGSSNVKTALRAFCPAMN